ncbi:MAG: 2-amino-4-hydroxy-6-hydroxymethyldihydropteridine diphosphokinase [Thiotrichales bacterium]|nr:2-amino-4-hydroxy-6-hydroxymethyldihydropteridine diphosphokinase [Thiotrichales bacterium]
MTNGELHTVYIGFGGNIGDVANNIAAARQTLDGLFRVNADAHSSLYLSKPHGVVKQDDFINAVSSFQTSLAPIQLFKEMLTIENTLGRVRERRWGPRTIDLDLLLYGEEVIETEALTVPHPHIQDREFVLYPLNEIAPDLVIPERGPLSILLNCCADNGLKRLEEQEAAQA